MLQRLCIALLLSHELISTLIHIQRYEYYILDTMVCTGCCATLDTIITYLFKRLTSKKKKNSPGAVRDSEAFLRILELHPDILQQVLPQIYLLLYHRFSL